MIHQSRVTAIWADMGNNFFSIFSILAVFEDLSEKLKKSRGDESFECTVGIVSLEMHMNDGSWGIHFMSCGTIENIIFWAKHNGTDREGNKIHICVSAI